jgi:hypothetical protein
MEIINIKGLTVDEINRELQNGAKFIIFRYCISIVILSFKANSAIFFIKSDEKRIKYGISYILLTLFFGWWGIPWGPIYSIGSLYRNFKGGEDVTNDVVALINKNIK